jgi:tetratricopeptide (TPR) repeat protein
VSRLSPDDVATSPTTAGSRSAKTTAFVPGRAIGRYLLLSILGEGGMGTVYTAYDPKLDRKVALKVLRGGVGEHMQTRLLREAQAMARLPHPNVVPVHDVGTEGAQVFIAMELVEGTTVAEWVQERKRPWREIVRVFREAGRGLQAAHTVGLVHRDFKPTNLLIDRQGRVMVTDFGLVALEGQAREVLAEPILAEPSPDSSASGERHLHTPLTEIGVVMGTPAFMAPEQFGEVADARSDQFSFCVSLHWALYGQLPFPPRESAALPPMREPPTKVRIPGFMRRILLRGMKQRPEDRYSSMQALLDELAFDPARQRNRILLALGMTAVLAGAALGQRALERRQARACTGAEAQLVGAWDTTRRTAVQAAFVATGKPFAADAFARAALALDDYAQKWVRMRSSACEATRVRGEQSEELLDLRMQCLDRRRVELGELVGQFSRADGDMVSRAVQVSQSLTPLDGCANVAALKAPVAPPLQQSHQVDEVGRGLARVRALGIAGHWPEGLAAIAPLVEQARRLGHKPLEAEALYELGYLQSRNYQDHEAEATLRQAVAAAVEGRHDAVAASAIIELVLTIGPGQHRYDEAEAWAEHAFAWLRRLGGDDQEEAKLHGILGNLAEFTLRLDEGGAHLRRALALREKRFGPDGLEVAQSLIDLGDVVMLAGHLDEAEGYLRRACAIQEKVAPFHPEVSLGTSALGDVLFARGRYDEALALFRRALAAAESLGPEHYFVAINLVRIGVVDARLGQLDEAQRMMDRSLALLRKIWGDDHEQVGAVWASLGGLALQRRQWAQARAQFERANQLFAKLPANHPDRAVSLAGLGTALLGLGRAAEAIAPLERALALRSYNVSVRADAKAALGRALLTTGRDRERGRALLAEAGEDYRAIGGVELARVPLLTIQ